jgi:hypothetical protein
VRGFFIAIGCVVAAAVAGGFWLVQSNAAADRQAQESYRTSQDAKQLVAGVDAYAKGGALTLPTGPEDLKLGADMTRAAVGAVLKDGPSARWGAIWTVDGVEYCGLVNSKDSYGAYTGFQRYYAVAGKAFTPDSDAEWAKYCGGNARKVAAAGNPGPADL